MQACQSGIDITKVDVATKVVGCGRLDGGDKVVPPGQACRTRHPGASHDDQLPSRIYACELSRK